MKISHGGNEKRFASVNSSFKLETDSIIHPVAHWIAHSSQNTFSIAIDDLTTPASTAEVPFLYIKYTATTSAFNLEYLNVGNDGAAANKLKLRMYLSPDAPSANNSTITPRNQIIASNKSLSATIEGWDGVGSGMTVASNGNLDTPYIIGEGQNHIPTHGHPVLTPNSSVLFTAESVAGVAIGFSFQTLGYILG
jgi:hypothetical protein